MCAIFSGAQTPGQRKLDGGLAKYFPILAQTTGELFCGTEPGDGSLRVNTVTRPTQRQTRHTKLSLPAVSLQPVHECQNLRNGLIKFERNHFPDAGLFGQRSGQRSVLTIAMLFSSAIFRMYNATSS